MAMPGTGAVPMTVNNLAGSSPIVARVVFTRPMRVRAWIAARLFALTGRILGNGARLVSTEPDGPWHLLSDPRLRHMRGGSLYPAVCFLDGKPVSHVTELIAMPEPDSPAPGALRVCLLNGAGRTYCRPGEREAAKEWRTGIVSWRRVKNERGA